MRYFIDALQTLSALAVSGFVVTLAVPFGRDLIMKYLAGRMQHGLNRDLEGLRSELRKAEEEFKSQIRASERRVDAVTDSALQLMSGRQTALTTRRLQVVDRLWVHKSKLDSLKVTSRFMMSIDFEFSANSAENNQKTRDFFKMLSDTLPGSAYIKENLTSLEQERPFLSPLVWALYSAYRSVLMLPPLKLTTLAHGMKGTLILDQPTNDLLKAALPEWTEFIDKHGAAAHDLLLPDLEQKLLSATQEMLSGKEDDAESLEMAKRILLKAADIALTGETAQATASAPPIPEELKVEGTPITGS